MKKILYIFFLLFAVSMPAQIVINGAGVININGGTASANSAYLVLNPVSNTVTPITTMGITGGIMMETEYSITKYNLGVLTNTISTPYFSNNSGSWVQFPLAVTGISGSVGSGNIQFSSKHAGTFASGYQNSSYMPSDVTNMNGWNSGIYTTDNSINAIDRFWIIDALGYTTSPAATYNFGYITAEGNANGGNVLTIPNLEAEPWDRLATAWAGSPTGSFPVGVNSTGATEGNVSTVSITAGQMGTQYRSWTLVDKLSPLPVDLLDFTGACLNNGIKLNWSTASESNSNYYTIEKGYDGQNFNWLANIPAAGNSNQPKNYNHFDANENITTYYRLSETDKNGQKKILQIRAVNACNGINIETANIFSPDNHNVIINVNSLSQQTVNITGYDATGRLIIEDVKQADMGNNNYQIEANLAAGMYLFQLKTTTNTMVKKVIITK